MLTAKAVCGFIARWMGVLVLVAAVAAMLVPEAFVWIDTWTINPILGLIMFGMGLTLSPQDFKVVLSRPKDVLLGCLAQFVVMPLLAWLLCQVFALPQELALGVILVGCCPGGVSSNIMSFLCKGDVAFSVGLTTVSTLAAPVMTPFLMLWLARESVDVDAVGMFTSILFVTILPVALGFVLNTAFGTRTGFGEVKKVLPGVAVAGLACIVGGVVSAHGQKFAQSGVIVFVAVFCHNALGYVLGYASGMLARFTRAKRRTVSIEVGMQNAGLATVLAGKHFPTMPEAAIASAVSCVWHSISGALLAGIFNWADSLADRLRRKVLGGARQG